MAPRVEPTAPQLRPQALRGLLLAAQLGSVTSAARALGLSQPGLSKLLRELEVELGASLLVRSHRGVSPTPQGELLLRYARRSGSQLDALRRQLRRMDGSPGARDHDGGHIG